MKYNVGDIIIETCFKYESDWRTGYIVDIEEHYSSGHVITIKWFDYEPEDAYTSVEIDRWIEMNNARHYSVDK
jgi:hypothetical protein